MRALITADVNINGSSEYPSNHEIRQVFKSLGLNPRDYPPQDGQEDDVEYETRLIELFRQRAEKILSRIPEHNDEQREKKEEERRSIIYAFYMVKSDTDGMVTRRSDGTIMIRLLNSRIGKLQEGAYDIVQRIRDYSAKKKYQRNERRIRFILHEEIELYEHGLEEPTVSGSIIHNRMRYLFAEETKDVIIAIATLVIFVIITATTPSVSGNNQRFGDYLGRLETAMLTTYLVAMLSLVHAYYRVVPVIQWSVEYKRKKR